MADPRFLFVGEDLDDYLHECPDDRDCERCDDAEVDHG